MSRKLDRARPLWELHVVDGPAGRRRWRWCRRCTTRWSTAWRRSTSGTVLLDPSPEPMDIPPPDERRGSREPYDRRAATSRAWPRRRSSRAQQFALDATARALDTSPRTRRRATCGATTDLLLELARQRPQAPMTPLNEPSRPQPPLRDRPRRRWRTSRPPARPPAARSTTRCSPPSRGCCAATCPSSAATAAARSRSRSCPCRVRREDERGELGNRISTVFVDLPIDASPTRRRGRARDRARRARSRARPPCARARCSSAPPAGRRRLVVVGARAGDGRRARAQPRRLQRARARSSRST